MAAAPPAPGWSEPGDTTIDLDWTPPPPGVASVELQVRDFPKPWDAARTIQLSPSTTHYTVTGLLPQSTFEFRLVWVHADGSRSAPGPAASADTQAVGCTPSSKKGKGKAKGGSSGGCVLQ